MFETGMITKDELFYRIRESNKIPQLPTLLLEEYTQWDKTHPQGECITFCAGAFIKRE
jgi:hypothetical protein